jgi:uncharacterized integral membrane protein
MLYKQYRVIKGAVILAIPLIIFIFKNKAKNYRMAYIFCEKKNQSVYKYVH